MNIQEFRQRYPQYRDISDEQLATRLHKKYYSDMDFNTFKGRFLGIAPPSTQDANPIIDTITGFVSQGATTGANALKGVYRGFQNAGEGVAQTTSSLLEKIGVLNPGYTERISSDIEAKRKAFDESSAGQSFAGKAGRFVGEIAPWMLIPGGVFTTGLRGAKAMGTAAATGGLLGGGIGGLQYSEVEPEESQAYLDALLAQKAKQTKTGVGIGTAAGLLFGIPGAIASKANEAFVKRMSQNPETASAVYQGVKRKVPVFTSDVSTPFVNRTGELLEYAPVGMIGKRLAQNKAAKRAVETFTDEAKKEMLATKFGGRTGLKRLEALAKAGTKRSKTAHELLEDIRTAGDDWNRIIQTSGNVKLFRAKLIADKKFEKVRQLADEAGAFGTQDKSSTLRAIEKSIQEATETPIPRKDVINSLEKIREYVQKPSVNYSNMMEAASDVRDLIDNAYKGVNAAVGKKGVGMLQRVKEAIEDDLVNFSLNRGKALRSAQQSANAFYKKEVLPAKSSEIAKLIKTDKPDELYKKFIRNSVREDGRGRGSAIQLYKALDEKGRAAVRYGMISDALNVGLTRIKSQQGISLSPAKFANILENVSASKAVFFKGPARREVDGLINLMRAVQRSGQVAENPPTGHRLLAVLAGAATTGGVASAGLGMNPTLVPAVGGALFGLRKLLTTDAGRRLLSASSRVSPGSNAANKMVERVIRFVRNLMIVESAKKEKE